MSEAAEVQREVARVTREPVDQPVPDHDFREEEIEIPMHAERAFVRKRARTSEKTRTEQEPASERTTVVDEVRKERADVERRDDAPC